MSFAQHCTDPAYKQKVATWQRNYRINPSNVAAVIYKDSRKGDKKLGRDNDLDRVWIQTAIEGGCSYCGETELRMTLDRIDNTLGHVKTNVVPACIRCNYLRRDAPFEAWSYLLTGLREAREQGAFGSWDGSPKRKK